ncbi:MAG: diguanylate cyclase [Nevskia sp.]|nr:diguanylate cyclase [Nevskia sp.]
MTATPNRSCPAWPAAHASERRAHRLGAAVLALLACLAAFAAAGAAEVPLRAGWLAAQPGQTAADVFRPEAADRFQRFDPATLGSFPRNPDGVWVRLTPALGIWPQEPMVLEVPAPPLGAARLYRSDGEAPQRTGTAGAAVGGLQGHGRFAFRLTRPLPPGGVLLLYFEPYPTAFNGVRIHLRPLEEFFVRDTGWLAFASVCFATMATMALVALVFGLVLGDATFHFYSGYLLGYALLLAIQTGFAFHPLGLGFIAPAPSAWGRTALTVSTICFVQFLSRFTRLEQYSALLRRLIGLLSWAMSGLLALSLVPAEAAHAATRALINPVLLAGSVLALVCSVYAAYRGSRYAVYFLAGWTPLLGVTALGSAQALGVLSDWVWLDDGNLAAGAYESVALSIGLAARILTVRRERDRATAVADRDSLTGVLNRRGWTARLEELLRSESRGGRGLAVMFVDIDHFKSLNDCFGHDEGDLALKKVAACLARHLRPGDILGRYGGEEFVAILPGSGDEQALAVGERVRAAVEDLAIANDTAGGKLTASVGIAIRQAGEGVATLTGRADHAMYAAKRAGRNRVVLAPAPERIAVVA